MTPAEKYLLQIEAQVRAAHRALADEHEDRFRRAVMLISLDAQNLDAMVARW